MSRYRSRATVGFGVASLVLLICAGCWLRGPRAIIAPTLNETAVAKAAMDEYDADKNGKISGDELAKCPGLAELARQHHNEVTADDIINQIKQWKITKVGRVSYRCVIKHNGQPLADATVKLVPDKFMPAGYPGGEGKTDAAGAVAASVPVKGDDPPGMPYGYFRIEVTKDGENIPAQYNTDTKLGALIAGATIGSGTTYNMNY
jgi:hypothetical protein